VTQERANPRDSVTNEPPEEPIVAAADAGAEVAEAAEHARPDPDLPPGPLLGVGEAASSKDRKQLEPLAGGICDAEGRAICTKLGVDPARYRPSDRIGSG